MIREFTRKELKDRGLPYWCDDGKIISNTVIDQRRWVTEYELIWRFNDQPEGQAYQAYYSKGSTECQEERPWEYEETVKATVVHQVERVVEVWEPIR